MKDIKKIIKKMILFQYLMCFFKEVKRQKNCGDKKWIQAVFMEMKKSKIIVNRGDKIEQYEKMVQHLLKHFKEDPEQRFIYEIDENCIFINQNRALGNIPVNYETVSQFSFDTIQKRLCTETSNKIVERNNKIFSLMKFYIEGIQKKITETEHIDLLQKVLFEESANLETALQRLLFWNSWLWQTGHIHNGLGRLDKILWPSYQKGKEENENAKKVIKDFLLTLHDHYAYKSKMVKGDTGQIIILGGNQEDGHYFCNELTYLFLECLKELQLPDPKILLRVGKNIPEGLIRLACECISTGIGSPILSNDEVVIPDLQNFGYQKKDAANYAVSACWEPLSCGNSLEQNNLGSIEYAKVITDLLEDPDILKIGSFDELLVACNEKLKCRLGNLLQELERIEWEEDPLLSFFTGGCSITGKDISQGGAYYNNYGVTSVGMGNLINSLLNIKYFVFEEKIFTWDEVVYTLKQDYENNHNMRKIFENAGLCFGMDEKNVIGLTNYFLQITEKELKKFKNRFGGKVKFGLSSPFYIVNAADTQATPDGRKRGEPLEVHISCKKGISFSDLVLFSSQLDYSGLKSNGNVVDLLVQKDLLEKHLDQFCLFIHASIVKGFFQMQFNVVSYEILKKAQQCPEKYQNLIVRVWGFSAYFNDIPKEYQDVLIHRAAVNEKIYG